MTDNKIIKACGDVCNDNRFELIKQYTKELLDHTNIETSKQEMEVIDNVLFRFWQMGWLDKLEECDRQKAEIERLSETVIDINAKLSESIHCFTRMETLYKIKCNELKVAKSEARKELIEKIKSKFTHKGKSTKYGEFTWDDVTSYELETF